MYLPNEIKKEVLSFLPCPIYQKQRRLKRQLVGEIEYHSCMITQHSLAELCAYYDFCVNYHYSTAINLMFISIFILG